MNMLPAPAFANLGAAVVVEVLFEPELLVLFELLLVAGVVVELVLGLVPPAVLVDGDDEGVLELLLFDDGEVVVFLFELPLVD